MSQETTNAVNTTSITAEETVLPVVPSTITDQTAFSHPSTEHVDHVQDRQPVQIAPAPQSVEDIDSTLEIIPTLNAESMSQAYGVIDQTKKQALITKFEETINNPRFWAKASRYDALNSALSVPVFDDKSLHQYYIHATDDLINEAALQSVKSGRPVVMPTEDEIKAEAWRRCEEGLMEQEIKSLNQLRKAEAKIAGTKPVKVTPEDVKAKVDSEMAKLRASENC